MFGSFSRVTRNGNDRYEAMRHGTGVWIRHVIVIAICSAVFASASEGLHRSHPAWFGHKAIQHPQAKERIIFLHPVEASRAATSTPVCSGSNK